MIESTSGRRALLFGLFWAVALGLGYSSLQRYDPATVGLADVGHYRQMVRFEYDDVPAPFRYRVLVPSAAGVLHHATRAFDVGNWNREMAALLAVNAAIVAITTLVLLELAAAVGVTGTALALLPWLYLSTFAVANAHLAGLVDSAEALAVCLVLWLSFRERWAAVAATLAVGTLAKETALILAAAAAAAMVVDAFGSARHRGRRAPAWWLAGVAAGLLVAFLVRRTVGGGPEVDAATRSFVDGLLHALGSKSLLYTFAVIGPLGLIGLTRLPRRLVLASVAAALVAMLGASYADIGENVSRPLFDALGPLLCISSAIAIGNVLSYWTDG